MVDVKIAFTKMHGAGNDFVMIDDRSCELPLDNPKRLAALANRPTGIGCEGIIVVRPSTKVDFAMRFFNPDGGEAEMCGNGARCVAAFAASIGVVKGDEMTFETRAGLVRAWIRAADRVMIALPDPKDLRKNYVDTGVPHAIVPVEDLEGVDVDRLGREIRYAPEYAPRGTNVDFVTYQAPHRALIRTYERGVEAESFACGTGAVAAAVIGVESYGLEFPVIVKTRRGDELEIDGLRQNGRYTNISLIGPVHFVFSGTIEY